MSEHRRMRLDLGGNITAKLEEMLSREFTIVIVGGLPPDEIAVLAMEVGASVTSALILLGVQLRKPDDAAETVFDDMLGILTKLVADRRDQSLAELNKRRATMRAERVQ
ncbi:MAG: hypothetical protein K2W86_16250 [Sphingomonas sp.]|uniref:hypothetical protein n=1 Tax=Sphingomonas sp. TaxID=28214 RepID=UPI0035A8429A|nr:hypothetical protein [Sphingomonas sp.]